MILYIVVLRSYRYEQIDPKHVEGMGFDDPDKKVAETIFWRLWGDLQFLVEGRKRLEEMKMRKSYWGYGQP